MTPREDSGLPPQSHAKQPRSCGFLIVSGDPVDSFLLMKHPDRWDLPKGHVDPGETDLQCALRELDEETGIGAHQLQIDPDFRFEQQYQVNGQRYGLGNRPIEKTLLILLGRLPGRIDLTITEHSGYQWFRWSPPHHIQEKTIDPLLAAVARHLQLFSG